MSRSKTGIVVDETKKREILAILSVGGDRKTAARYLGCTLTAIANEAKQDKAFAEAIQKAEQSVQIHYLKHIQEASKKTSNWRAAAWALERRWPEQYAARKPNSYSFDDMLQLIEEIARVTVEEIESPRCRKRILKEIERMLNLFFVSRKGTSQKKITLNVPEEE